MKLTRIAISNSSRMADIDIEVRDHLVVVGSNAVGKSTVLRLLDLLLGASWSQLFASLDQAQLRDPASPLVVEARLEGLDDDDKAHFAAKAEVGTGPATGETWLTMRLVAGVSTIDSDRLEITRSFVKPLVEDAPVTRDDLARLGWAYLQATRSPDRELGAGRASAVRTLLQAVALSEPESSSIDEALATLTAALTASQALSRLREDLARELTSVYPSAVSKDDIVVDLPTSTAAEPLGDVDIQMVRAGVKSPLTAQSDGLRSLAVIAVQLLATRTARMLAIDEPEIHLHMRGQANLARLLATAPGQRVVATHAPAVLAEFQPPQTLALASDGARQLTGPVFAGNPKNLQHWWVDSALEPLTADRLILVEGISDRILVRTVARHLKIDLDRLGISVVAVHGAGGFKAAIELFGPSGFGIPTFGLVDENEASIPADALNIGVADLASNGFVTCVADLEEEYVAAIGVSGVVQMLTGSGLFTEAGLVHATGAADVASITPERLREKVLKKNKVEAATALGEQMALAQANALTKAVNLVQSAAAP